MNGVILCLLWQAACTSAGLAGGPPHEKSWAQEGQHVRGNEANVEEGGV